MAFEKSTAKLQRLLNLMDDDALTKETFKDAFSKVVELVKKQEADRNTQIVKLAELIKETKKELGETNQSSLTESLEKIEKELKAAKTEVLSDNRTITRLFEGKLKQVEDLIEYYDDQELRNLIEEIRKSIPEIPDKFDASEIESKLKEQEKEIEELKKRPAGTVSGGVTNARIEQAFKYILKTEQPVGDIDGANTTYTVSKPIFAVLAFSLNSAVITELPNYTINGNTIEFSTALPAAYSGEDFEIKYV